MRNSYVIEVKNIGKKYILHHEKPTLVESVIAKSKKEEFWALRHVNLNVRKGERVGIIGSNGSGKTTLLRIIVGITNPTEGSVETSGKIVSLIDLEAGFHPELTGEENIYLNGMLVGMSKKEIGLKYRKIISFSGIGKFIDTPYYMYSSGMKLRLGFSVAINSDPEILILDENISVGDQEFREESFKKLNELFRNKKTIITVSHDLWFIKNSCDRIIWFDRGIIKKDSRGKGILRQYQEYSSRNN
ncbi:MAG TPA: ABC transporter ATP-binding protein [Patescibacteria group bacterium]|nr:ABC transporter ATP-binding protein [Patescibacteria group bacterium]